MCIFRLATILVLASLTTLARAADAPALPSSAEKLTADQIIALYDGKTYTFMSYTRFGVATGAVTLTSRQTEATAATSSEGAAARSKAESTWTATSSTTGSRWIASTAISSIALATLSTTSTRMGQCRA